ncbi:MAG: hypothetical protein CVU92_02265 [Firmicutes bacterium HGW-Firmicutes-17]|nr:MAG: hypothetical protein CVU92_02265 [Firmicutes bacterium HGW-Firmicutes-17]
MDVLKLVSKKDLIDFSQNLSVTRNYLGDRLFPDIKTPSLEAEFYRLSDPRQIPKMAKVHAFDTEAAIGIRPDFEKVSMEKMLIKEKINQTERVDQIAKNVEQQNLVAYIFDDMARLAESVKTRTEVAKMELIQSGKIKVKENGLDFTVDYGVPAGNKKSYDWSLDTADVLGDIQAMKDIAKDAGYTPTNVITSSKIMNNIRKNKGVQTAIYGTNGVGTFLANPQIDALMLAMFGFTIEVNDERYSYETAAGVITPKRYIEDTKFVMLSTLANGTLGSGLWGVTPEESKEGPWSAKSAKQFITITQWETPDPVATWTKASGLFIPAMPNAKGIVIGTITMA